MPACSSPSAKQTTSKTLARTVSSETRCFRSRWAGIFLIADLTCGLLLRFLLTAATDTPAATAAAAAGLSPAAIAEGTALVEEFLHAWTAVAPSLVGPSGNATAQDVDMIDLDADDDDDDDEEAAELIKDYDALVRVFNDQFKDRFEATEWTRTVLSQTY